jgi:hypothetical protein
VAAGAGGDSQQSRAGASNHSSANFIKPAVGNESCSPHLIHLLWGFLVHCTIHFELFKQIQIAPASLSCMLLFEFLVCKVCMQWLA